jgi:hypothetical protein
VFTVAWNVVEALVAVGAGMRSGSVALVGFQRNRSGLRGRSAPSARALYVVGGRFFALAAYVGYEAVSGLLGRDAPETSPILVVGDLAVLPTRVAPRSRPERALRGGGPTRSVVIWQGFEALEEAREGKAESERLKCPAGRDEQRPMIHRASLDRAGSGGEPRRS